MSHCPQRFTRTRFLAFTLFDTRAPLTAVGSGFPYFGLPITRHDTQFGPYTAVVGRGLGSHLRSIFTHRHPRFCC